MLSPVVIRETAPSPGECRQNTDFQHRTDSQYNLRLKLLTLKDSNGPKTKQFPEEGYRRRSVNKLTGEADTVDRRP